MKLYIYDEETREVVAVIDGDSNEACEGAANERFGDEYLSTYSPAFGTVDGLIETEDTERIEV